MILTGKAKDDFLKWVALNRNILADYHENHVISDMVDWLDSVGLYINITPHIGGGADVFYSELIWRDENFIDRYEEINFGEHLNTRQEAYKQAIIKATEIYNNLNK